MSVELKDCKKLCTTQLNGYAEYLIRFELFQLLLWKITQNCQKIKCQLLVDFTVHSSKIIRNSA